MSNIIRGLLLFFFLCALTPAGAQRQAGERPRIQPNEANKLFQSVDRILRFVSESSGLPVHHSVKRELASTEEVKKHVRERMEQDEDAKRFEDSQWVLKKLGLLPRQFNLNEFLISLYGEQVAGFYDFKKQTIYLLDWVQPAAQEPVLAHELTHAVQDQNRNLDKWMKEARELGDKNRRLDSSGLVDADEHTTARSAVTEGQAMLVLIDYMLAPTGKNVLTAPEKVRDIRNAMSQKGGSPVFDTAPLLLREALVFPYSYGLDFAEHLLKNGGKQKAFAGALQNPPRNTHHVMYPASYLANENVPPIPLPGVEKALGSAYRQFDAGSIGQLDAAILLEEYDGEDASTQLTPAWRGGVYMAAWSEKRDPQRTATGDIAILYVSRWATPQAAQRVARAYGNGVLKRYAKAQRNELNPTEWTTNEGLVTIEARGDMLLVMESFDAATQKRLRESVWSQAKPAAAAASAQLPANDLAFRAMPPAFTLAQRALLQQAIARAMAATK